jgi:chromosome segregation ATPase
LNTFDRDRDVRENELSSFSEAIEVLQTKLEERERKLKSLAEESANAKLLIEENLQHINDKDRELASMRKQIDKLQTERTQLQNDRDYYSQQITLLVQDQNLIVKDSQVNIMASMF